MRSPGSLPPRQLVSQAAQAMVESPQVPRSRFVTTWTRKQTFNMGLVIPFMWDEVLPADHLRYDTTAYLRMATPIAPMFSNVKADVFYFFVPNRIIWDNFRRFMGEQLNPTDDISTIVHPYLDLANADMVVGTLGDYLGIPLTVAAGETMRVNQLPWRAYITIWNEWFRDQNLQTPYTVNKGDGATGVSTNAPLPRGKFHDYFTSSLPWTQKFTSPTVPLTGTAKVSGIGTTLSTATTGPLGFREANYGVPNYAYYQLANNASIGVRMTSGVGAFPDVYADLSTATGISISQLRQSMQIQRLLERDARSGTRYNELVLGHFGVRVPDYRLDRPEYIGGGSAVIQVTPVAQTAPVTGGTPLGTIGGAATSVVSARASYASTEHGIVMGLISVRAEQAYQQGLPRKFSRTTRYDYAWPELSQLGEQAVLRQEIYATGNDANDSTVWGYQERYAEYRQYYSEVAGRFRSGVTNTLDLWHLAENFGSAPVLGSSFIQSDNLAADRVLSLGATARTNHQQFLADIMIRRDAVRPLPMFGTPMGLGRF